MRIFSILLIILVFCYHVSASTSYAKMSDDAILVKLDAIDQSIKDLKETVISNKSTSDTRIETKCNQYDSDLASQRERITALEVQIKILWSLLGIGVVGTGSIYGGIKFQHKKNGSQEK